MILSDAVKRGHLEGLEALRDRLAREIDECESSRDVAALANRLADVLAQIDQLQAKSATRPATPLDEISQRRARRKAAGQ